MNNLSVSNPSQSKLISSIKSIPIIFLLHNGKLAIGYNKQIDIMNSITFQIEQHLTLFSRNIWNICELKNHKLLVYILFGRTAEIKILNYSEKTDIYSLSETIEAGILFSMSMIPYKNDMVIFNSNSSIYIYTTVPKVEEISEINTGTEDTPKKLL